MNFPTETLLAVDGHSLSYRAYYALGSRMHTHDGAPVGAVYGFMSMLSSAVNRYSPDYLTVAFDTKEPTFRHKKLASYKATRKETPEDFISQLKLIQEMLSACEIVFIEQDGVEADDVLATLSKQAHSSNISSIIASGDRDLFQLVSDPFVSILYPSNTSGKEPVLMREEDVLEKTGVMPSKYVQYAALRGDTSDNLPGVPGVGEKTAARLLDEYGSIGEILANAVSQTPKLQSSLMNSHETLYLNMYMMTLKNDIELPVDIHELLIKIPDIAKIKTHMETINFNNETSEKIITQLYSHKMEREELFSKSKTGKISEIGIPEQKKRDIIADIHQEEKAMIDTYGQDTYDNGIAEEDSYHDNGNSYETPSSERTSDAPQKDWDVMTSDEKIEKLKDVSQKMWDNIKVMQQTIEELSKNSRPSSGFRDKIDLGISPVPSDWTGRVGNWMRDKDTGTLGVCVPEDSVYYPDRDFVHSIDGIDYVRVAVVSKKGKASWVLIDTREDGPGRISSPFTGQYDINKGRQLVIVPNNMWLGVSGEPTDVNLDALEAASQKDVVAPIGEDEEPF